MVEPRLRLVIDGEDAVESTQLLQRLHDPQRGRAVAVVTPGANTRRVLGWDIMRALGRDPDALGGMRNGTATWVRATLWSVAEELDDLIITRAHLLRGGFFEDLIGMAYATQVRLWLVCQSVALTRTQRDALRGWPLEQLTANEFRAQWSAAAKPRAAGGRRHRAETETAFPEVPLDDATSFLASCHDLLAPEEFVRVRAVWGQTKAAAEAWLASAPQINEISVRGWLRQLLDDARSLPELLTRVRGAQVALFLGGWLVRTDTDLLARIKDGPRVGLEDWVCELLRNYATPRNSALAALSLGCGLTAAEMLSLNVGDIELANSKPTVSVGGKMLGLDPRGRVFVGALLLERQLAGAGAGDPLFAQTDTRGSTSDERWTTKALQTMMKRIERESGLPLTSHWQRSERPDDIAWTRRRGVLVEKL